jgi:hypothetical protein
VWSTPRESSTKKVLYVLILLGFIFHHWKLSRKARWDSNRILLFGEIRNFSAQNLREEFFIAINFPTCQFFCLFTFARIVPFDQFLLYQPISYGLRSGRKYLKNKCNFTCMYIPLQMSVELQRSSWCPYRLTLFLRKKNWWWGITKMGWSCFCAVLQWYLFDEGWGFRIEKIFLSILSSGFQVFPEWRHLCYSTTIKATKF